jgi:hypothetical protein
MKKIIYTSLAYIATSALISCSSNEPADIKEWAGQVESKTNVIKPEGFQEEYWASINKNVNYDNIFKVIVDAVIKGKKQAYDIITDKPLSIEEVKQIMGMYNDPEDITAERITSNDLSAIRMRESWTFNEKEFSLQKKVKRIDLLLKKIDPTTGEYLGDRALFYIKLEEDK